MITAEVSVKNLAGVSHLFNVLPRVLREEMGKSMKDIANIHAKNLRLQLLRTSKRFDYKIFSSIKAEKKSDFKSIVKMSQDGLNLDSMKTHWVSLKKGRRITQWAIKRKLKDKTGRLPRAIQVRAHPFIDVAFTRTKKRINTQLKNGLKKTINRSRK